jgi:hypothetical protein
VFSRHGY